MTTTARICSWPPERSQRTALPQQQARNASRHWQWRMPALPEARPIWIVLSAGGLCRGAATAL